MLLWDVHNRSLVRSLKGHGGVVQAVAFSPNGTMLASGGMDNAVWLWDIHSGQDIAPLKEHEDGVWTVAFSPDGATLASGSDDNTINLWNVASRKRKARLEGHTSSVFAVAFSPDGKRLASASRDGTVKLWDPQTGRVLDTMKGHSHMVFHVAFSPDGRTLASDSMGEVKLWDLSVMREPRHDWRTPRRVFRRWQDVGIVDQGWSAEVVGHRHGCSQRAGPTFQHRSWRLRGFVAGRHEGGHWHFRGHGDAFRSRERMKQRQLPGQHESKVEFVMFSPTGKYLASVAGSELKLWDLANNQLLANLEVFGALRPAFTVAFSPDGTTLAIGCQEEPGKVHSLKLWDLTRKKLATLDRRTSPIASSAFSPDGEMLASGNWDGEIKIWNVRTGTQLPYTIEGHTDPVSSLAFSRSGKRLASTSGDGTVKLWDVHTGDQTMTLKGHRSRFSSVAFSPDDAEHWFLPTGTTP